jgi:hypothetical protein
VSWLLESFPPPLRKGERKWFEYHCEEGDQSADAHLWHRSHTPVRIIRCLDAAIADAEGVARVYRVKFEDGFVGEVFDDELMDSPSQFFRPDPPNKSRI